MYDRLGELLREALDKGAIPQVGEVLHNTNTTPPPRHCDREPKAWREATPATEVPPAQAGGAPVYTQWMKRAHVARADRATRILHGEKPLSQGEVLRSSERLFRAAHLDERAQFRHCEAEGRSNLTFPPEVKAAFAVLGLAPGATLEEVKAAWREKLKMFHPDSNSDNEVVQKVAKQKTMEVMAAYKVITAHYSSA